MKENEPSGNTPLFEIEALRIAHGQKVILDIERLEIPSFPFLAIIGPNGAGKSTLLKSLLEGRPNTRPARRIGAPPSLSGLLA
jgi:ABC-type Mn2+/Zn2+ transport system ATPase subunit